jgi:mono/diheme cytochrome c family protein
VKRAARFIGVSVTVAALSFAQASGHPRKKSSSGLSRAPQSAHFRSNPYDDLPDAVQAGGKLFARHCAECHGADAQGSEKAPRLRSGQVAQALPGDLFWFLTNGDLRAGMPSWSRLPEPRRWQIVTYLKSLWKLDAGTSQR